MKFTMADKVRIAVAIDSHLELALLKDIKDKKKYIECYKETLAKVEKWQEEK